MFLISLSFGRVLIIFSDCFLLLQNHSTCRFILLFKHSVAGLMCVTDLTKILDKRQSSANMSNLYTSREVVK